jgi:hypothetical protein
MIAPHGLGREVVIPLDDARAIALGDDGAVPDGSRHVLLLLSGMHGEDTRGAWL